MKTAEKEHIFILKRCLQIPYTASSPKPLVYSTEIEESIKEENSNYRFFTRSRMWERGGEGKHNMHKQDDDIYF